MIICNGSNIVYQVAKSEIQIQEALTLRHDIYLAMGYIDEPCENSIIPDEKNDCSEYIVGLKNAEELVGTIRLTPVEVFKEMFCEWEENFVPDSEAIIAKVNGCSSVELGALAVKRGDGNRRVSWGLYKATYLYSLIKKIDYWVIAMDNVALRSLEMLGWHVERVGDPIMYMGSMTTLGIMPVREQLCSIFQKNQRYYHYLSTSS